MIINFNIRVILVFDEHSLNTLGMSDHRIADSDILAGNSYLESQIYGPWLARLHSSTGCWVFPRAENFLLVDLGEDLVSVSGVATQGCNNKVIRKYGHVLEYQLSFSDDGANWYYYREGGGAKVWPYCSSPLSFLVISIVEHQQNRQLRRLV